MAELERRERVAQKLEDKQKRKRTSRKPDKPDKPVEPEEPRGSKVGPPSALLSEFMTPPRTLRVKPTRYHARQAVQENRPISILLIEHNAQ